MKCKCNTRKVRWSTSAVRVNYAFLKFRFLSYGCFKSTLVLILEVNKRIQIILSFAGDTSSSFLTNLVYVTQTFRFYLWMRILQFFSHYQIYEKISSIHVFNLHLILVTVINRWSIIHITEIQMLNTLWFLRHHKTSM